jgi:hypothetical protein
MTSIVIFLIPSAPCDLPRIVVVIRLLHRFLNIGLMNVIEWEY